MDNVTILGSILLFAFFATSIINASIAIYFLNKLKETFIEKNLNLNTKEFDLIQRQYVLLQVKADLNTRRIDSIEKVLSALIIANTPGDGGDGILH